MSNIRDTEPRDAAGAGAKRILPRSPAAERNKDPILNVLRSLLPEAASVLEVASGTGQHAVHFAEHLPHLTWQPSEADEESLEGLRLRVERGALPNVRPPLLLDVLGQPWPLRHADAVVCINMIHIAPWAAAEGLLRGSAVVLGPDCPLILYGPFRVPGRPTAPSNEAFDLSLRQRDASWGLRDLDAVVAAAAADGFKLARTFDMPANNLLIEFRRVG